MVETSLKIECVSVKQLHFWCYGRGILVAWEEVDHAFQSRAFSYILRGAVSLAKRVKMISCESGFDSGEGA